MIIILRVKVTNMDLIIDSDCDGKIFITVDENLDLNIIIE